MAWCFRSEYVRCGKDGCNTCPHGPYWYGYFRVGTRVHKRYFGKRDPRKGAQPHPWDVIFCAESASVRLACEILNLAESATYQPARRHWNRYVRTCHPDRGGNGQLWVWRSAAWSFLKASRGWW
jgi:hypothetical protein